MTLHTEELFLKQVKSIVYSFKDVFELAKYNCHVKSKLNEYTEQGNAQKTLEYRILKGYISKRMQELLSKPGAFKPQ